LLDYAELCLAAGHTSVAKATLLVVNAVDASSPRAFLVQGQLLEVSEPKDFEGAVKAYRRALELAPKYARALNALGLLLMRETPVKNWEEARRLLDAAIQLENPPLLAALTNLAILRVSEGKNEEAKKLAEQVLARDPKDPSIAEQARRIVAQAG
jgi:Tfp pilus assembly protein PilF